MACAPGPARATDAFYYRYYGRQPPLSLPQGLRATILVPVQSQEQGDGGRTNGNMANTDPSGRPPIDVLRDLFPALAACWQAPDGLSRFERTEITARFSLRRDGSLIGAPRITFSATPGDARARQVLIDATLAAVRRCTPARITAGLGGAIAGRPIALRFVYTGPRGQGV